MLHEATLIKAWELVKASGSRHLKNEILEILSVKSTPNKLKIPFVADHSRAIKRPPCGNAEDDAEISLEVESCLIELVWIKSKT